MKKIKVSEATTNQLDWLVARCLGLRPSLFIFEQTGKLAAEHNYSTDQAQGGKIIDLALIATEPWVSEKDWVASMRGGFFEQRGATRLIAAMRSFVCSKIGDGELDGELNDELDGEVEIPEVLCEDQTKPATPSFSQPKLGYEAEVPEDV